jgi:hypothetical protein
MKTEVIITDAVFSGKLEVRHSSMSEWCNCVLQKQHDRRNVAAPPKLIRGC